ncbi:MAG TPA: hypothetical protein VM871_11230 [Flavisolibacter sp.]|jgi:hypothetical protein|nr:hypothetical protein [Flavisolibacter sp.]
MKNTLLFLSFALLLFCRCSKKEPSENLSTPSAFKEFIIPQGQHYATENAFKPVEADEVKFFVRFDSSAIYQTTNPENQHDINKLWGFADNGEGHQQYSARFGWRWSDGSLRLFAYTYNNGVRAVKELGLLNIGEEVFCSIKVAGDAYLFSFNDKVEIMSRASTTTKAKGYQLYPYFGGNETAPHEVRVWIKSAP